MYKNTAQLVLALSVLSGSIQAQESIDTTRLVFDITLITEGNLPLVTTKDEADESNENYRSVLNTIDSYEAELNRIQQLSIDPYNYELVETYTRLGDTHQGLGRHDQAIAHYDNALQILKVQGGLNNPDQLEITGKIIQSHNALGDMDSTSRWHEYQYYLHQQNYEAESPEMIQASNELADWYLSSYFMQNFQDGDRALDIMLNTIPPNNFDRFHPLTGQKIATGGGPLSRSQVEDVHILTVARLYEANQQSIFNSESPNFDAVVQNARRFAGLYYTTKQEIDYEKFHNAYIANYEDSLVQQYRLSEERLGSRFDNGGNYLRYVVDIMRQGDTPPEMISAALFELADWNLAFGRVAVARTYYEDAYQELISAGLSNSQIDDSMNFAIPLQIPLSATHPFTRKSSGISLDEELEYRGYIDVSFEVDNQGNPQRVIFTENDRPESGQIEQVITNQLRTAKFRPQFSQGQLINSGRVELRYYYSY
ncbi:MAG: hypothetical protein CMQ38_06665 [Gammaproteobacteria bacterium]|nr:hypothetical protein [Gammaproteobacteria bacterium]